MIYPIKHNQSDPPSWFQFRQNLTETLKTLDTNHDCQYLEVFIKS